MHSENKEKNEPYLIHSVLNSLEVSLIASCQPVRGGPLDRPEMVAAMAQACVEGGAKGLRIEGIADLKAVASSVSVPIVGIIKRPLKNSPICITPYLEDVVSLAQAGAQVIAVDATNRIRSVPIKDLLQTIRQQGCVAMADCSNFEEAAQAHALGFDIVGTTMSGYTGEKVPDAPDWKLLEQCVKSGFRVMAEGRYSTPALAMRAIEMGAWSVTVGTALTRIENMTAEFVSAVAAGVRPSKGAA